MNHVKKILFKGLVIFFFTSIGIAAPPSVPVLSSPAKGAVNQSSSLFLNWKAVPFAVYYHLQISTDSNFSSSLIDNNSIANVEGQLIQNSQAFGLTNNTKYYWRVAGNNIDGESAFSAVWDFTTIIAPPIAPTLVSPSDISLNQPTSVTVTWNAVSAATSYDLQLSLDPLFNNRVLDTTLSTNIRTISNLANGTSYYWRVRANNVGGNSAYTNGWKFTTIISTPLIFLPANNAINQPISLSLQWKAVPFVDAYHIQVSVDSTFLNTFAYNSDVLPLNTQDTQYVVINGLTNNTKYFWRLNAYNATSTSVYSSRNTFTTIANIPPTPTLLSPLDAATLQPTSLMISWNAAANATTYRLQVAVDAAFTTLIFDDSTLTSLSTSKQITTLVNNKQYFWRVNAKNIAGTSGYSLTRSFKTIVSTPTIISPTNAAGNQPTIGTLRWNSVSGSTAYHVQIATSLSFVTMVLNDSTLLDSTSTYGGLTNSTMYYWRVRSANGDGWGNFSSGTSFTTIIVNPTVPALQIPLDADVNQSITPTLSWSAISGATSYRLQVSTDSLFSTFTVNDSSSTVAFKAIGSLKNFQKYFWRVSSKNIGGSSPFSSVRGFTTIIETPKTLSPAINAANQTLPTQLKWSFSFGATQYRLQISTSTLFDVLAFDDTTLVDTTAALTGLLSNTKYFWRIAAHSIYGWSTFSASSNFTTTTVTPIIPAPLLPLSGSINQQVPLTLTWTSSYGASNYKLQISTDSLFTVIVLIDSTINVSNKTVTNLLNATNYYWRVLAKNSAGSSLYSVVASFVTGLTTPTQIFPALNAVNQSVSSIVKWSFVQGATQYHLQVSTSAALSSFVLNDSTVTDTVTTVNGLSNITKYYWRIAARNANIESPYSSVSSFTTADPPPASPVLSLPVNGTSNLPALNTLSWQSSVSATSYRLQVSVDTLFSVLAFDDSTISTTSKLVGPLPLNLAYYWRVAAKNPGGSSSFSAFRSFSLIQGTPVTPVLITPANNSAMQQQPTLFNWQVSPGTTTYRLQISIDTLFAPIVFSDSTISIPSTSINGLLNNTTYYWRVNAKNSKGTSSNSPVWKFTTSIATPIHLQPLHSSVSQPIAGMLNWNGSLGAAKYHLQLAKDSNFTQTIINDSLFPYTSMQYSGLQNNTVYYWRVKALSQLNQSSFSIPWKFITIVPASEIPLLTSPQSGSRNNPILLALKWKSAENATEYHLQISTDSPFQTLVYNDSTIVDTSRYISSLNYNTTYYWRVRAKNVNGSKGFSDVWSFNTIMDLPDVPVLASPVSASINQPLLTLLRWNSVSKATRYHLQISTDSPFKTVVYEDSTIADTSRQIIGLKNNTRYYWRIQAVNAAGSSSYSSVWNFSTTTDAPITPTLIAPNSASSHQPTTAILQWKPIANATAYSIQVATDSPFEVKIFDDSTLIDTVYQIKNLIYNTRYYWRVRAYNNGGSSPYSQVWNFTTMMQSPEIPLLYSPASASINQPIKILLCWNSSPGSTVYQIQLAQDSPFKTSVFEDSIHADTSVTISNLKNETKYFWRVRGKNNSGLSAYSTIWSFTTAMTLPNVPALIFPMNAVGNEPSTVALKWNSAINAQSYHVQVSDDSPFRSIVFEDSTLTDTVKVISPLRAATKYYWRVRSMNSGGSSLFSEIWNFKTSTTLGVQRNGDELPKTFALQQNFPNPFNPSTTISFSVAEQAMVTVSVYDVLGRTAETIVNEDLTAGYYHIRWRAEYLSAGIYFYRIVAQRADKQAPFIQLKKMILLK